MRSVPVLPLVTRSGALCMVAQCARCGALVFKVATLMSTVELDITPGEGRWSLLDGVARFTGTGLYTNHALTCPGRA
jgi:hypothetical protein